MAITERIKWIVLPSLLVIGIGILEIKFPHAMDGFDDSYTGRGVAGPIMLLFELFLMLTWGKIAGIVAILLGILVIIIFFLPEGQQSEKKPSEISAADGNQNASTASLSSFALQVGKAYLGRRLKNRQP